jgi:RsiW-degrading membrane proteinase PrsW (M82 family)
MNAPERAGDVIVHPVLRRAEPALWIFVAFVVYGTVRIAGALADLADIASSAWALAWLLAAVYALPAFVLIYELDLYEREPVPLLLGAFAWGAFAATALSLDASGWNEVLATVAGTDAAARWGPVLVSPVIEEILKGSGVVLLVLVARSEVDDVMDGFVYGAVCGLGFAVIEDVVYFAAAFGGSLGDVAEGFAARVLASGLYGHVLYTGLIGMGIAAALGRRGEHMARRRRLAAAVVFVALGVAGHALWNSPFLSSLYPDPPLDGLDRLRLVAAVAARAAPLALVVLVAVALAHRRERRWIAGALTAAARGDAMTPEEASSLVMPGGRRRAVAVMRRRAGRNAATFLRRLQREQLTLAMLLERGDEADPAVLTQRSRCRSLRLALDAIPGAGRASVHRTTGRPTDGR